MQLMSREDVSTTVKILARLEEQMELDKAVGLSSEQSTLLTTALRQCHIHSCGSTALDLYHSHANKADTSTFRDSLLLILDLLYENQEYESCATLAKQLLTSSEVKSRIPNLEDLEIVFIFGVLSAFRMNSVTGLQLESALLSRSVQSLLSKNKSLLTNSTLLFALYCLLQKRVNAGLNVLDIQCPQFPSNIVKENLKILAFLDSGHVKKSLNILSSLESKIIRSNSHKTRYIMFSDVFKRILNVGSDELYTQLIHRSRTNMDRYVQKQTLEEHLFNQISQHAHSCTLDDMLIEDEGHLDDYDDAMLKEKVQKVTGTARDSPLSSSHTTKDYDSKNTSPVKSTPTEKTMKIVNGYIVFTDDAAS